MTTLNIVLIDKRVQDYETLIAAVDPALAVGIVFDYEDTFETIKTRMVEIGLTNIAAVGLIQHNYKAPMFTMLASADVAPVAQVAAQDPDLAAWTQFRNFITWCKTNFNAVHFDMMACALYSDPDWKYVIDTLTAQTGVTVRASTDDTGAASLGGDWFLESHTGVNLKTVYFTEAIEEYQGLLLRLSGPGGRHNFSKGAATGSVITWGGDETGLVPSLIQSDVIAIYSAYIGPHAALKSDGSVVAWGDQRYGGILSTHNNGTYTSVASSLTSGVVSIYSTERAFAALKSNGSVVAWGDSPYGGAPNGATYFPPSSLSSGVVAIYSTTGAFAALKSDGSLQAWGGQFRGGWFYNYATTAYNSTRSGVVAVYSSPYAFVALKSNGSLVMWPEAYMSPVYSSLTSGVVAVYSTQYNYAALKNDGRVITWGDPNYAGNTSSVASSLTSGVVAVYSSGHSAFAALKNDGSVVTWGDLIYGGDSSSVSSSLTSGVVAVYSGGIAFAALKSDGSVITWGKSDYGGNSSSVASSLTSGVVAIYPNGYAFAALKSNGSVITWGLNNLGGNSGGHPGLTSGVVAIYLTGGGAYAALKSDGSVITWGGNGGNGGDSSSVSSSLTSGVIGLTSNQYSFAALKTSASTFDLSGSVYTDMDRYTIIRNKESRRRVNLTTLNNNVFTLSSSRDIQVINPNIPAGRTLKIIIPTYVASSYSITSDAVIPNSSDSFIIACDESEPVTISGTTYVNYGAFVYQVNANGTYTKVTSATINGTTYTLYGGDGVFSSGIVFLGLEVSTLSASTFSVSDTKTFGDASFAIITHPTSNSSGAITYSSSNTSVATIDASGSLITLVGAGEVTFTATQAATAQYAGATKTSNTLTVALAISTLSASTFSVSATTKTYGDASFNVTTFPTSNSAGAITYSSSNTNVAIIDASSSLAKVIIYSGNNYTGSYLELDTGNYADNWLAPRGFNDNIGSIIIPQGFSVKVWSNNFGGTSATYTSNISITTVESISSLEITGSSPPICRITIVGAGSATFTATQAATSQYASATKTSNALTVDLATSTLSASTFSVPATKMYGDAAFSTITLPTSNGNGAITYSSSNTSVATIDASGSLITLVGAGETTFTATQAATAQYAGATKTSNTLTVSLGVSTFAASTFSVPDTKAYGDASFNIVTLPVGNSTGAITYVTDVISTVTQIGADINGEAASDSSGYSVSMSSDGYIVAIGALNNDGNGNNSGQVRVYVWNSATSEWIQRGQDINGEASSDQSGYCVSLSADGSVVAIGAPNNHAPDYVYYTGQVRVYDWNSGALEWVQRGVDIDGEAEYDLSGWSASLSADGNVIAIGAPQNDDNGNNSGHVRVYSWNSVTSEWIQRGADIIGESLNDFSGVSVSLSSDGTVVAIGADVNDGNGNDSGQVRVYSWNSGTSEWLQRGQDIDGQAAGDNSGRSVSISSDGSILAIGAPINRGYVRVYMWNSGTSQWVQRGGNIDGEELGDRSGTSVCLSSNGNAIAIGAPFNDYISSATTDNRGHVRIYDWNNGTLAWDKRGDDINGEASGDNSGGSVALSSDGTIVAIGARWNNIATGRSGHVRVYSVPAPGTSTVASIHPTTGLITLLGTGIATFTATQAATNQYPGATKTSNVLTVSIGTPTLSASTFSVANTKMYGDASFNSFTRPTSNSSGAITYSSSNPSVATVDASGEWITIVSSGTVTFTATQVAVPTRFIGATKTSNMLSISVGTSTFSESTFSVSATKTYGDASFSIIAPPTSNSSGAITYASNNTAVATIDTSGSLITLVGAGSATFTATQAATAQYAEAFKTSDTLTVYKATPTLAFVSPPTTKNITDASFVVIATSASPGAVTYASSNTAYATVGSATGRVTLTGAGTVTITAYQASSTNYNAPTNATCSIVISAVGSALAGQSVVSGTSFANLNLAGASLAGTTLSGVSFSGATLTGANFAGAVIAGTNFTNANISGATNLPTFSTVQKLQLLRNINNVAIGAVQISTPVSGADISALISTPIPGIDSTTAFTIKAPTAVDASSNKLITVSTGDVSNNTSVYIPLNTGENVNINGTVFSFNGVNLLDVSGNVRSYLTMAGVPFKIYAGSIIGLNLSSIMNQFSFTAANTGLYDILAELYVLK